jgi:hypothetical protein
MVESHKFEDYYQVDRMSRFFPHTAFEEDQPWAHTILATHVLTRGAQAGALVSLGVFGVRETWSAIRSRRGPPISSTVAGTAASTNANTAAKVAAATARIRAPFIIRLLRSTGMGTAIGFGLLTVGLGARMWGRSYVEWQDRAWRLLENKGQVETDDWTYASMAVGLVGAAAVAARQARSGVGEEVVRLGWRGVIGGAGLGSILGMFGYMGWRYGVHGGKFPERERELT